MFRVVVVVVWSLLVVSFDGASGDCFPYILQNECTSLLGNVSVEESEQQDFFDQKVSLTVSNFRMVQASCRRPLLSYFCQLLFGGFECESSSSSQQGCLEGEYCLQVAEACSSDFQLDCSSNVTSSSSNCSDEVKKEIDEVKETPIAVETCLNKTKETIVCCPDPFIFDDNDECVVECYQYLYGEKIENIVRLCCFSMSILSLVFYLIALIPLSIATDLSYPNHIILVSLVALDLSYLTLNWSSFAGGPETYVCGGEKNYWIALNHFRLSPRSVIQFSIWVFFLHLGYIHFAVFSFNLFCHAMRPHTKSFEIYLKQPADPTVVYWIGGSCILLPIAASLGCLIFGLVSEAPSNFDLFPLPIFGFPSQGEVLIGLSEVPASLYTALSAIFCVVTIFLYLQRGREIVYFQWRALLFGLFGVMIFFLNLFYVFMVMDMSDSSIVSYTDCVASHPQASPPPCIREKKGGYSFIIFNLIATFWLAFAPVILYWSNSIVLLWWKELLFVGKSSNYEPLIN